MLCSDTGKFENVHVTMTTEEARIFSELIHGVKQLGGEGRLMIEISGGTVTTTELTIKKQRQPRRKIA